jgi:hypothetical protein
MRRCLGLERDPDSRRLASACEMEAREPRQADRPDLAWILPEASSTAIPFYGAVNPRLFEIERWCMASDGIVTRIADSTLTWRGRPSPTSP